jgi:uncharacterized protein (DUF608 family)
MRCARTVALLVFLCSGACTGANEAANGTGFGGGFDGSSPSPAASGGSGGSEAAPTLPDSAGSGAAGSTGTPVDAQADGREPVSDGASDHIPQDAAAPVPSPVGKRIFKSPGASIMFEWPKIDGAVSYELAIDGKTVATIDGAVPFALVPVSAFGAAAKHTWSVSTVTGSGRVDGAPEDFALAEAVDGTTGAPLGGAGSGAVKYCPWKGDFAFQAHVPAGEKDYQAQPNTRFRLFTNRASNVVAVPKLSAAKANGRYDDDAIFPIERATFPTTNGVTATLLAFAPYDRIDPKRTTYPLAFYQFTLYNHQTTPVDVAVAFELDTEQAPSRVDKRGMAAGGNTQKALYAASSAAAAVISVGNDPGFASSGTYDDSPSGNANGVAVKATLLPGEKTDVDFVLSWYQADNPDGYYYANFGADAQTFAEVGLGDFDRFRDSAIQYVERFRASNVPDWILNQTMNFTTWTNSSIYTKDGRYSEWEGHYVWFGQMDQGWHAFGSEIWRIPEIVWGREGASEMEFWARTMMVGNEDGQISHDFTPAAGQPTDQQTCAWDAPGYHGWGGPDWVDLDCGFLFGVYEGFVATGDKGRMDFYWPYVKRTAERLYKMASTLYPADGFPFTFGQTGCTYDKGTQNHQLYNSGLAITAFKLVSDLAAVYGETDMRDRFMTAYTTAIDSYRKRWLVSPTTAIGANQEAAVAGLWMGLHYKQPQPFGDAEIDSVFNHLFDDFWNPLDQGMAAAGTKGEDEGWIPYVIGHLGGAALETGRVSEWRALQKDSYDRYFGNRSRVFNGDIYLCYEGLGDNFASNDFSGHNFYVSLPVVWHNYYALIGFWYNAYTGELYVQPKLPSTDDKWGASMQHELTNAFFVIPGSYGSLDYRESGVGFVNKDVVVRFDASQKVNAVYLTDDFGPDPKATVDGVPVSIERVGTGKYDRKLKLLWNGTVGPTGIHVVATGG